MPGNTIILAARPDGLNAEERKLAGVMRRFFRAQAAEVLAGPALRKSLAGLEDAYAADAVRGMPAWAVPIWLRHDGAVADRKGMARWWHAVYHRAEEGRDPTPAPYPEPPAYAIPLAGAWDARLVRAVLPVIENMVWRAALEATRRYPVSASWTVVDRSLPKAAQRLALKFAESTNRTTSLALNRALANLRDEIEEGIIEGDTGREMRRRVQTVFESAGNSRASTIARTEASRARHTAEIETAKATGVVKAKRWLVSDDACQLCLEMGGDTAGGIPLDEPYTTTDYGPVDGPPLHPNCRCSQVLVLGKVA